MKKILSILMVVTMTTLSACQPSKPVSGTSETPATNSESSETKTDGYRIGFVSCNLNDTGQTYIAEGAKEVASANGVTIEVQDASDDVIKQQDQARTLIQNKVNALVVVPVDTNAMEPITTAAKEANIPLIYVNRNPFGENDPPEGVYYVGSQEIVAGRLQGEQLVKLMGETGKVAILQGLLTNEGAIKRTEGNEEIIKKYPGIEIVTKESGDWQRDKGLSVTENWMTTYGADLKAILSNNDEMALGAVQALTAAGRTDVIIMGVDATPDAIKAVEEGKLSATVLQDLKGQGEIGMDIALKALKNENPAKATWIDFKLVTKDNVAEFK